MPQVFEVPGKDGESSVFITLDKVPISPAARQKALMEKFRNGDYSKTPPPTTPSGAVKGAQRAFKQGYTDVAGAVTNAVSGLIQGGGNAMQSEAFPGLALAGQPIPADLPRTTDVSNALAAGIVPQTPTQAGVMLGTAGTGGLAAKLGLSGLSAAAARIGGAAVGGEAGNQMEGGPLGAGAIEGATMAGVPEAAGAGYSFLRKSVAGGMTAIAQKQLDEFRDAVAKWLPGITTPKNASGVKELIRSGSLLNEAGTKYADSVRRASEAMGDNMISVPALADKPMSKSKIATLLKDAGYGDQPITPDMAVNLPTDIRAMLPDTRLSVREAAEFLANAGYGQKRLTLSEAVEKLKEYGQAGYGGGKELRADRTLVGRPSREQWEAALQQIRDEIRKFNPTGEALAIFDAGRKEYAVASTIHGILKGEGVYIGVPNDVRFNPNAVRQVWERKFPKVQSAVPADEYTAIHTALYGDAPFGSRDLVRGGPDTMTSAAQSILRSGGGATTGAMAPVRSLFPGAGNVYTGQRPFAIGQGAQTGIDLGTQAASYPLLRELGIR